MNQVYVLLGAPLLKLIGKRIVLWRNHPHGTLATRLAVMLSDRVLCTSERSFTARFRKTRILPVGINTVLFSPGTRPTPNAQRPTIAYVGRIGPVKRLEVLIEALGILCERDIPFTARIIGDAGPGDVDYLRGLVRRATELGIGDVLAWHAGVPMERLPAVYRSAAVVVNLTPPGSFDKVILEALACETPVITANTGLRGQIDGRCLVDPADAATVAARLEGFLELPEPERAAIGAAGREYVVREHGLDALMERLVGELHG
jgi:glycosyltransferase involved in cell wall biosynthesis